MERASQKSENAKKKKVLVLYPIKIVRGKALKIDCAFHR